MTFIYHTGSDVAFATAKRELFEGLALSVKRVNVEVVNPLRVILDPSGNVIQREGEPPEHVKLLNMKIRTMRELYQKIDRVRRSFSKQIHLQDKIYQQKLAEAKKFLLDGSEPAVDSYLQLEHQLTGKSIRDCARSILTASLTLDHRLKVTESYRREITFKILRSCRLEQLVDLSTDIKMRRLFENASS